MARVKPAGDRIANWDRKYNPKSLAEVVERGKGLWLENAREGFAGLADLEVAAKNALDAEPSVIGRVAQYLCFVREAWKVSRSKAGPLASMEMSARIAKWTVRTLDPDIMWKLSFNLLNITRPASA